jgi:hypothetical protein
MNHIVCRVGPQVARWRVALGVRAIRSSDTNPIIRPQFYRATRTFNEDVSFREAVVFQRIARVCHGAQHRHVVLHLQHHRCDILALDVVVDTLCLAIHIARFAE